MNPKFSQASKYIFCVFAKYISCKSRGTIVRNGNNLRSEVVIFSLFRQLDLCFHHQYLCFICVQRRERSAIIYADGWYVGVMADRSRFRELVTAVDEMLAVRNDPMSFMR